MVIPSIVINGSDSPSSSMASSENSTTLRQRTPTFEKRLRASVSSGFDLNKNKSMTSMASSEKSKSRGSFSMEARNLKKRASQMIVEVPVAQLKKIRNANATNSLQRETQHFVGITTLHGPLRIYRGKRYSTIFWAIMMLVSFIALAVQMVALLQMYSGKPTVSEVSFLISQNGMDFPMITICNFNPIRRSYIKRLNRTGDFSEDLLDYMIQTNYEVHALYANGNRDELQLGDEDYNAYRENHTDFNLTSFFERGGHTCDDVFKICSFAGQQFNCCEMTESVITDLGKCYMMDVQKSKFDWMHRQTAAGVNSGLQLILDTHLEEQFDGTGNEPQPIFANAFENGFRYFVHARETIPHIVSEGISVSPGSRVYSALVANRYVLLDPNHWGNCSSKWPSGYGTHLPYSASNCAALCKANYFFDKCGCSPFIFNIDNARRICTPYETYKCMQENFIVEDKESRVSQFKLPPCTECVMECDSWGYASYNSYGEGFSNGALKWIQKKNNNWTAPHVRSNFLTVNVFFREMTYTEYAQKQSTSLTEILSDIGGNMGMFLGMSLLTLIETIIYVTKISWIAISKKRRDYMLEKKLNEESKMREMEETMSRFKSMTNLNELDTDVPTGKLRRLRNRIQSSFRHSARPKMTRMNRIRPIVPLYTIQPTQQDRTDSRSGSIDSMEKKSEDQRRKFMSDFYDSALYGDGRARKSLESELDDEVIELKINVEDLEANQQLRTTNGNTLMVVPEIQYMPSSDDPESKKRKPSFYLEEEDEEMNEE